jgi:hypothetical protein
MDWRPPARSRQRDALLDHYLWREIRTLTTDWGYFERQC